MYDKDKARKFYEEAVDAALELMERKNADYSGENVQLTGPDGMVTRLVDKVLRLRNLTRAGGVPNFESLDNNSADIANYAIITRLLLDDSWELRGMVYLAGPIDMVTNEEAVEWRSVAKHRLARAGYASFDPSAPYALSKLNPIISKAISAINRAAIDHSVLLLANLSSAARSLGTIREVEYAAQQGIQVYAFGSDLDKHVEAHDLITCETLEDALYQITLVSAEDVNDEKQRIMEKLGYPQRSKLTGDPITQPHPGEQQDE